jgi:hypothetical protein
MLLMVEVALSRPLISNRRKLAISTSDRDNLVCYMQTVNGVMVNLTNLCGKVDRPPQVAISNVIHDGEYTSGQVINQSSQPAYQVRVHYEVLDQNDRVLKSGSISANPSTLKPGEAALFEIVTADQQKVRATFAESKEPG